MAEQSPYDFLYDLERVDFCGEGLHYIPRVQYGREHPRQYLECIFKDGTEKRPVLVWIHGGGWQDDNLTTTYRPERTLAELAKRGWFIACIEYRLAQHGSFPVPMHDCQEAVKFLRANCARFGIDPDRIALWGESAGAHLACMVGANFNNEPGADVQAVVSWFCPSDLEEQYRFLGQSGEDDFVSKLLGENGMAEPERAAWASPVTYADKKMPPVLLMHGDADELVNYEQSARYYERLKAAGNDALLVTVPGQGHGFFRGQQYYDAVMEFLEKKV